MRPVVQTVRGPQLSGKRSSIATQNFASASPASFRAAMRVVPAILLTDEIDLVLPDADDGGDDADRKATAFERVALLDMRFQISDVPARLGGNARSSCEPHVGECVPHGAAAGAVACGINVGLGHLPDIGARTEEVSKVSFLVAPGGNFDRAFERGGSALSTRAASSA